jgi:cytochrome c oxidase assembly protein subunit 11
MDMPVSFFVDPAIVKDPDGAHVRNITLSYTFYPVAKPKTSAALPASAPAASGTPAKSSPHS